MVGADVEDLEDPGPSVALNHNDGHLRVFIRDCSPQAMPAMDNARAVQAAPLIGSPSAEFKQNHRVYNFLLYATARTNDLVLENQFRRRICTKYGRCLRKHRIVAILLMLSRRLRTSRK